MNSGKPKRKGVGNPDLNKHSFYLLKGVHMKKYKEIDELAVIDAIENTLTPIDNIARQFEVRRDRIIDILQGNFTQEFIKLRKSRCYAASKQGNKNPMWDIKPEDHPMYTGEPVEDGNGYLLVRKPDWYTGRKGSRYVFMHSVVFCEAIGITEVPAGFIIHHIDGNTRNNSINNLALVNLSGHQRIHSLEEQRLAEMRRELAASEVQRIYRERHSGR